MIDRPGHVLRVQRLLRTHRVVAILGARQVGKTTLAGAIVRAWRGPSVRFDLESPRDLAMLADPLLALESRRGLVVLDEVQRLPEVFPVLRVLADRPRGARFVVLGSASPELLRQGSETLAGRIAFHQLPGLGLSEVGGTHAQRLWERGGFPRSYTARSVVDSYSWREAFIQTFLERDLPQLGVRVGSQAMGRFWSMLAHWSGQTWNGSEFARAFGVSDTAVRHYLDLLTATFVVRQLQPWHENLSKRQVKSPKVHIADTGLLHTLLGIRTYHDLERHPKVGASWEAFALDAVTQHLGATPRECFFWATHAGAELDLLVVRGERRIGFEFKRSSTPSLTPSMRTSMVDLKLTSLDVLHPGTETYPLAAGIRAVGIERLSTDVRRLVG